MIDKININKIEKLINNKKILYSKLLSKSFNINCYKFTTSDKKNYIVKYYNKKNYSFNAISSETKNLLFLNNLNLKFFPKAYTDDENYLVMSYTNNNGLLPNETRFDLLSAITSMHSFSDNKYGFIFDTQIGGLQQNNKRSTNWVDFYREHRLGYIYEIINKSKSMDPLINKNIEFLLKNLENYIPKKT